MTERPASCSRRELLATLGTVAGAAALWPGQVPAATPELPLSARELWAWVRAQQVLEAGTAYLDTGSAGPALRAALVAEYRSREAFNLDFGAYNRTRLAPAAVAQYAGRIAAFAGADADELTFTTGATEALNLVAGGLDLAPDDEVIVTTHEHAAHLHAWLLQAKRRGVIVRQVPLPSPLTDPEQALELLTAAITPRTRVLAFSHVQYTDGALLPVRELCEFARARNIATLVDGSQAFGMLNFALRDLGCDFYATGFAKWLNGGHGTGMLYLRREWLDRLWPLEVDGPGGWNDGGSFGLSDPADAELRSGWPAALRKFGTSYRYFGPLFQGLGAAFDLQERLGRARVEARIRELALYARLRLEEIQGARVLTPNHPFLWAGLMSFTVPSPSLRALAAALAEEDNIVVRAITHSATGFEALRVSTHVYNSHDEIDRLLFALERRRI